MAPPVGLIEAPPNGKNGPIVSPSWETQLRDFAPAAAWSETYNAELHRAYRTVAAHVYGPLGVFAYAAFGFINATYFEGKLPETLILWDLIERAHCLGKTRSPADGPPIIKLHPSIVHPKDLRSPPWGIPLKRLGFCFAFDTLLHECIHASVEYLLGGWQRLPGARSYWTSHNNPLWVAELNRIAPMLGYQGDRFTMLTPKRVPIPGTVGPRGKPKTKTVRGQDGGAPPFERFPYGLPGREKFHLARVLPFPWESRPVVSCSCKTQED
jgi:hypothetical protein